MKPGGWADVLLFLGGSTAPVAALLWWNSQDVSRGILTEGIGIAEVVLLWGAAIYQFTQRRLVNAGLLYPHRSGAAAALLLGVAFPLLLSFGGRALQPVLDELGYLILVCGLPWALSRVQWSESPPPTP